MYKTNTLWEADDMLYKNAHIFTENGFASGAFAVEDGRFADILPGYDGAADVDLNQAAVIPGLIDVHNHGNSGADFSDGDYDGLVKMGCFLAENGITSFAPATMRSLLPRLQQASGFAANVRQAAPALSASIWKAPFSRKRKRGRRMRII